MGVQVEEEGQSAKEVQGVTEKRAWGGRVGLKEWLIVSGYLRQEGQRDGYAC